MDYSKLSAYEKLQRPIELTGSALRHRAALVTICTPVVLMGLYGLAPEHMPLMSLAVAKSNAHAFWLVMLTLVGWAFLLYLIDLSFAVMERRAQAATVQQGIAYEPTVWWDDGGPPEDANEQRPPNNLAEYQKWERKAEEWRNTKEKLEHLFQWITRIWMPVTMGLFATIYCLLQVL